MVTFERFVELLPWAIPVAGAIGGGIAWALTFRNREAIAEAEAAKVEVETDGLASTEWKRLYTAMVDRCDDADRRLSEVEQKMIDQQVTMVEQGATISSMDHKLDISNDTIDYLLAGINILIIQLKEMDVDPKFVPHVFRGDDGIFSLGDE